MQKEYDALIKNGIWKLVDTPLGPKIIGWKWLNKYKVDDSPENHKARLVEKCFKKKRGQLCRNIPPIAKWSTISTLLSLEAQKGQTFHQVDVGTAFLNGDIKEKVFMSQPKGFVVKGQE